MTISADAMPEDGNKSNAIAPVGEAPTLDAFTPDEPAQAHGFRARLLDYSAHAAMIVGLIGFAWTVGDHVVHRSAADLPNKAAAMAVASASEPAAEPGSRDRELTDTVRALQAKLDALQASIGDQGKVAAQVRVLQAGLDNVRTNLGSVRSEHSAALARLDGKLDKLAQPTSKMQGLVDRLGKLEHSNIDVAPTASLPHAAERTGESRPTDLASGDTKAGEAKAGEAKAGEAKPVPRPGELKSAEGKPVTAKEPAKPAILAKWVVRDVYQGVALIEGRRGTLEVVPGVSIPGAGIVKSIDRHGSGWTVTTTKGVVAYAAPPRAYRRADRGFYPEDRYRYDF